MKQVDKEHYDFEKYCGPDRWGSYYYQIKEIIKKKPATVLEAGGGDGVLRSYLLSNTDINHTSLDIAEDLHPDVLGSVDNIPLEDHSFDITCAFEVLEHLPFEQFEGALQELRRVSKGTVLLSLPHFGPMLSLAFKIPFLKHKRFAFKIPYHPQHKFDGEHYWEIGKKGYPIARIRTILSKYFTIERDYVPFEHEYHHFFILMNK